MGPRRPDQKKKKKKKKKGQAKKKESGTDTQRVCMEAAQTQRVVVDKEEQKIGVPSEQIMMENDDFRTEK